MARDIADGTPEMISFRFNASTIQRITWRQPALCERWIKREAKLAARNGLSPDFRRDVWAIYRALLSLAALGDAKPPMIHERKTVAQSFYFSLPTFLEAAAFERSTAASRSSTMRRPLLPRSSESVYRSLVTSNVHLFQDLALTSEPYRFLKFLA